MKNLVLKIKYQLFDLYQEYKYENLIYKKYKQPTPKWENIVAMLFILLNLIYMYYSAVSDYEVIQANHRFVSGLMVFPVILFSITLGLQARREFKSAWAYYNDRKQNTNLPLFSQKRFIFTSTFFTTLVKPAIKICTQCGGGILAVTAVFDYTYGFSPLRELSLAYSKTQTWEQASHHLFNPNEYQNSADLPYIQDIKNELLRKDNKIKELENLLNSTTKQ